MNSQSIKAIFAFIFAVILAFSANVEANRGGKGGSIIILGGQNQGHGYIPYPVMMGGWGCGHSSHGHGGLGHSSFDFGSHGLGGFKR
uniref:Uncharacterized protein n=1 Tax=Tetranychus urticae TaxID=32264 RepID=T1KXB7_TETUR